MFQALFTIIIGKGGELKIRWDVRLLCKKCEFKVAKKGPPEKQRFSHFFSSTDRIQMISRRLQTWELMLLYISDVLKGSKVFKNKKLEVFSRIFAVSERKRWWRLVKWMRSVGDRLVVE
jgi:hypothetical protein